MHRSFNKFITNTLLLCGAALLLSGCQPGPSQTMDAGALKIGIRTDPHPARLGDNTFFIFVRDENGKVDDASVRFRIFMPGMPMSTDDVMIPAPRKKGGVYSGVGDFSMGGDWLVEVAVNPAEGRNVRVRFPFTIEWKLE